MLTVTEARERILSHFQATTEETLPLIKCANRILAVDIAAAHELPLFNNSSMDGFAIRSVDSSTAAADSLKN